MSVCQATGGGAQTEECRRRVEEVERLLRENTEVRHVVLLHVGRMTVCMYVCESGEGGRGTDGGVQETGGGGGETTPGEYRG